MGRFFVFRNSYLFFFIVLDYSLSSRRIFSFICVETVKSRYLSDSVLKRKYSRARPAGTVRKPAGRTSSRLLLPQQSKNHNSSSNNHAIFPELPLLPLLWLFPSAVGTDLGERGPRSPGLLGPGALQKSPLSQGKISHTLYHCCGTDVIYSGSGSDFGKVSVPVPDPDQDPDLDHI